MTNWWRALVAGCMGIGSAIVAMFFSRRNNNSINDAESAALAARRARDQHDEALEENRSREALRQSYEHDKAVLDANAKELTDALASDPSKVDQALVSAASDNTPPADTTQHH